MEFGQDGNVSAFGCSFSQVFLSGAEVFCDCKGLVGDMLVKGCYDDIMMDAENEASQ
jgi:hypothetical protein